MDAKLGLMARTSNILRPVATPIGSDIIVILIIADSSFTARVGLDEGVYAAVNARLHISGVVYYPASRHSHALFAAGHGAEITLRGMRIAENQCFRDLGVTSGARLSVSLIHAPQDTNFPNLHEFDTGSTLSLCSVESRWRSPRYNSVLSREPVVLSHVDRTEVNGKERTDRIQSLRDQLQKEQLGSCIVNSGKSPEELPSPTMMEFWNEGLGNVPNSQSRHGAQVSRFQKSRRPKHHAGDPFDEAKAAAWWDQNKELTLAITLALRVSSDLHC